MVLFENESVTNCMSTIFDRAGAVRLANKIIDIRLSAVTEIQA